MYDMCHYPLQCYLQPPGESEREAGIFGKSAYEPPRVSQETQNQPTNYLTAK